VSYRSLSFIDAKTGEWINCFAVGGRVRCFVRDIETGRFKRFVRKLYIVYSASWVYCRRRTPSSNMVYFISVVVGYDWKDIALNRTISEFDDTLIRLDNIVKEFIKFRCFTMTLGTVEYEYIGVELTTVKLESTEAICRCPEEGTEGFYYTYKEIEKLTQGKIVPLLRCRLYGTFCRALKALNSTIRPILGAYSEVVFPTWCGQHV